MDAPQLKDLAFVYVGLAKGTDNQFHFKELRIIADLLVERSKDIDHDQAIDLVDETLKDCEEDPGSWNPKVEAAVFRLKDVLSEEKKRAVLIDLSQIGLADRKFLHAEAEYIHRVSQVWDVHLSEGLSETWSILGSGGIRGQALGALASLYLVMAYAPDKEISDPEREIIARQLGQWIPGADESEVDLAIRDAMAILLTRKPTEILDDSVDIILRLIPRHQYKVIYKDLKKIACADRVMLVKERTWLQRIAGALGLESE